MNCLKDYQMTNFIRFSIILALLACTSVQAQTVGSSGLEDRWLNGAPGYERAVQMQRELKVPLVVYFYTDWCPFCRTLDSQYFNAPPVQNYLRGVVRVRINPEHGRSERDLATQFGVTGFPTFFIVRKISSLPIRVHPFRRGAPDLSPAQFASAINKPDAWAYGSLKMSGVSVGVTPTIRTAAVTPRPQPTTAAGPAPLTTDPSLPTLNWILERYVQALGGKNAVATLTSRVTKGRIDVAGVSFGGRLETYAKAPNMSLTVMNTESTGVLKRGFDGRNSWVLSNQKGFKDPSPMELAAFAAEADFYRDIKLKELYPRISLVSKGNVGTRDAYVVEATSRFGTLEKLYFDVETGLLIRRDTTRPSSGGSVRAEFYFSDWRVVDGVKISFKTTEIIPSGTYIFTLEEVKHNVALDEEIFRQP